MDIATPSASLVTQLDLENLFREPGFTAIVGSVLTFLFGSILYRFEEGKREKKNRERRAEKVLTNLIRYQTFVSNQLEDFSTYGIQDISTVSKELTSKRVDFLSEAKSFSKLYLPPHIQKQISLLDKCEDKLIEVSFDRIYQKNLISEELAEKRYKKFNESFKVLIEKLKAWIDKG